MFIPADWAWMLGPDFILAKAKGPDRRIGIGASVDLDRVEASVSIANSNGYGRSQVYHNPSEMVRDLKEGRLDAAVRGSLDSNLVMRVIKDEFSLASVQRMALLQPRNGRMFFLAPVGVDEGWTYEQKLELAINGARLMRRMGVEPKVAFLSGGRKGDLGRHPVVDRTIEDAAKLAEACQGLGVEAYDRQILIEEAAKDCNLIIAPDGISGNLIFRTLHFLGDGKAMGAVVLNIDKVFVDTSRAKASYLDSIAMASALVGTRK
ncbi:MAG: methanogenesis marker protein Mmp4/MtxX [Methanomassiliicoccales archaeon]|nr:methanogenesis marker protein Mmp4/MtxX [Methanomassiliicoccales archaeon]